MSNFVFIPLLVSKPDNESKNANSKQLINGQNDDGSEEPWMEVGPRNKMSQTRTVCEFIKFHHHLFKGRYYYYF